MEIRDRILEAAKRVYAKHGFRGATTRLIAIEADVNEVTIFRTFGSKAALFDALMQSHVAQSPLPVLPDDPINPENEIVRWCSAVLSDPCSGSSQGTRGTGPSRSSCARWTS